MQAVLRVKRFIRSLYLLSEMGLLDKARITATDIDTAIISRAKSGQVNAKNMELNSQNYMRAEGQI